MCLHSFIGPSDKLTAKSQMVRAEAASALPSFPYAVRLSQAPTNGTERVGTKVGPSEGGRPFVTLSLPLVMKEE